MDAGDECYRPSLRNINPAGTIDGISSRKLSICQMSACLYFYHLLFIKVGFRTTGSKTLPARRFGSKLGGLTGTAWAPACGSRGIGHTNPMKLFKIM